VVYSLTKQLSPLDLCASIYPQTVQMQGLNVFFHFQGQAGQIVRRETSSNMDLKSFMRIFFVLSFFWTRVFAGWCPSSKNKWWAQLSTVTSG